MIIENLSEHFDLNFVKIDNEFIGALPINKGTGYIRSSSFYNEITFIEINGLLNEEFKIPIKKTDKKVIQLIFNLRWAANYIDATGKLHQLNQFDTIFTIPKKNNTCYFHLGIEKPVHLFIIEINSDAIRQKFKNISINTNDKSNQLINLLENKEFYFSKGICTLSLHNLIIKCITNNFSGKLKFIYQEALLTEIIVERFKQVLDDINGDKNNIQRKSTSKQITEAAVNIATQLNNLTTVKELAKNIGLSPQNLQNGFKRDYGCTVNQYIADLRLNKAIELLENTDLTMSEITYEIGLNSKSYFSKIFKDKFGISPSDYQNNVSKVSSLQLK